jgi:hypothetical protein
MAFPSSVACRGLAAIFCTALFTACSQPARPSAPAHPAVPGSALFVNGDFESDAIGAAPGSWTVQSFLDSS